jgi:hypothetical protein
MPWQVRRKGPQLSPEAWEILMEVTPRHHLIACPSTGA